MSKLKFGIGALQAFQENYQELLDRLIKGYRKMTNKEPEGLDLIKIKQEARQRAEEASKVVDMEGRTLDPSKTIMGGKQEGMFDDVFDEMYEESKGGIPMTIKGKTKTISVDEIMDFVQGKKGKESIMKADDAPKPEKTKTREMFEEFEERTNIKPGKIDYDKMEDKLGVELFGDETFDELLEIERTGKHPRMKADGGRIGFANGGENIIGADLKEKESVFFPKGDFENIGSTMIERFTGAAAPLAERVSNITSGIGDFFFPSAAAADFQGGEMLQTRASPVRADYERAPNAAFAELLAESATADDAFEEALAEATRKGQRQSFLSQVADFLPFGPKSLTGGITRGIGSMFRNIAPASYGTSSRAFNALTPQGRAAVGDVYGSSGIMAGYNPVSAFGRGPIGAIDARMANIQNRRAPQTAASQQKMKDLFAAREKIMQTTLDSDSQYTGPKSSPRGQKAGVMDDDPFGGTSGTTGGSSKIVCTMMNESYGFGNFRNKIWLRHSRDLPKEYEIGYHTIFLPLVKFAKGEGKLNKVVKKTLEHIARHRTLDLKQEMKGKTHTLGRVYRKILEPICLMVGKIKKVV